MYVSFRYICMLSKLLFSVILLLKDLRLNFSISRTRNNKADTKVDSKHYNGGL